jgi:hypothetical protein
VLKFKPPDLVACTPFSLCSLYACFILIGKTMPDIDFIRGEIERMRTQVGRQRREILQLQRAGASTAAAEILLQRMLIEALCAERDRLKKEQPGHNKGKVLGGRQW